MLARVLALGAVLVASASVLPAQDPIKRTAGEPLGRFAARVLPKGTELAHQPLEGRFGPGAGNVVLLFRQTGAVDSNYTGWVLVPANAASRATYTKFPLPKMREIPAHFEISVEAVFFANADSDAAPELIVLYSYHRNGSQDDDSTGCYVYHWTGKEFVSMEALERELAGFKSAAAIRAKLARARLKPNGHL